MRIGYLECFAGISGDMLLGALIDAGVSRELLRETAIALDLDAALNIHAVDRSGIRSVKVDVLAKDEAGNQILAEAVNHHHEHASSRHTHDHGPSHHHHVHGRSWAQIRELIDGTSLHEDAKALALRTFQLLAHAEAMVHGIPAEEVHFHEVGAVDTIIDIVCCAVGLCSLDVARWYASSVNVGAGFVECAHGMFPVPAPATAELLRGTPTYVAGPGKELTTPTGAALLRALGCRFGEAPRFAAEAIGYGAGTRNPERFPNVLRLSVGESLDGEFGKTDTVTVLECAIDDATPQILAYAMELVLENGALDVMSAPVTMKKGRLGTLLTVLSKPEQAAELEALMFRETTTLGIRRRTEERVILDRTSVTVDTPFGRIRVKVATAEGEQRNAMPEYEDCRSAAREHGVPLKQIMEAALAAYTGQLTQR